MWMGEKGRSRRFVPRFISVVFRARLADVGIVQIRARGPFPTPQILFQLLGQTLCPTFAPLGRRLWDGHSCLHSMNVRTLGAVFLLMIREA